MPPAIRLQSPGAEARVPGVGARVSGAEALATATTTGPITATGYAPPEPRHWGPSHRRRSRSQRGWSRSHRGWSLRHRRWNPRHRRLWRCGRCSPDIIVTLDNDMVIFYCVKLYDIVSMKRWRRRWCWCWWWLDILVVSDVIFQFPISHDPSVYPSGKSERGTRRRIAAHIFFGRFSCCSSLFFFNSIGPGSLFFWHWEYSVTFATGPFWTAINVTWRPNAIPRQLSNNSIRIGNGGVCVARHVSI